MYTDVIKLAEKTLAANQWLRQQTADLRARTVAIMLQYRRHRFPQFSGASEVNQGRDRICIVCRGAINSGAGRFRVGNSEFHPDCFKFWLTVPLVHPDDAVE